MWRFVGNDITIELMERGLEEGRLAHAYLLVGPAHVGKLTLALDMARALNCEAEERPCGRCLPCQRIGEEMRHADVVVLCPPSGADIGIDRIRELQHTASLKPFEGRHRVFIIDGAEALSREAANCLLKTLEEPPPGVYLILLATSEGRLLPTIRSRCQRVELRPLPGPVVERFLVEHEHCQPGQAGVLARLSQGCLGWAVSAARDDAVLRARAQRLDELRSLAGADLWERFSYAGRLASGLADDRRSTDDTLSLWLSWWLDLMRARGGCSEGIVNVDHEADIRSEAERYTIREIVAFIHSICRARVELEQNANPRLALEVLMLDMPHYREGAAC